MIRSTLLKLFLLATLICGTLDILLAVFLTLQRGKDPADMLRTVASGPFSPATEWGAGGAVLGLGVHFTLMAIMVGSFLVLVSQRPNLLDRPLLAGIAFGLVTYVIMNLIVVPLRWPAAFPPKPLGVATQLFAHLVLVALPTVLIARAMLAKVAPGVAPAAA
ncbi:MAG TPA: hypothetical protein VKC17_06140 [Sphingomicrobium sp.]|nr:hypothetical protein [Sphingomicrobium sp.]